MCEKSAKYFLDVIFGKLFKNSWMYSRVTLIQLNEINSVLRPDSHSSFVDNRL